MRAVPRLLVAVVTGMCLLGTPLGAQPSADGQPQGRRLEDALAELQRRGLKVIYSTEVVRPEMRVRVEPHAATLRRVLDALVAEHGLIARDGPGGTVLIVRSPRVHAPPRETPRAETSPSAPAKAAPSTTPPADVEPPRFEETIQVTDVRGGIREPGSPPLVVSPQQLTAFAGGLENVFRVLQALPGVTSTDELGSRIAVRGGGPDQNVTTMDGIEMYRPFRLIVAGEDLSMLNLGSAFNAEMVESFELVPGAFDVRYGDRLSSLLVVRNREGTESARARGSASVSLAEATALVEGKLPRQASGSWIVSARHTHLGLAAERVVGVTLPSFQDVQARASWRPRPQQRFTLVGLASAERTRLNGHARPDAGHTTRTESSIVAATFDSSVGSRGVSRTVASLTDLTDALSAYEQSLDGSRGANTPESLAGGGLVAFQLARTSRVRDLAIRQELSFAPTTRHWIDVGIDRHALQTRWSWNIAGDRSLYQANGSSVRLGTSLPNTLESARDATRWGAWIQDRWQVASGLVVQPGLRLDHSSLTGRSTVSPRVGAALSLGPAWRLDAAARLHTQTPGYEKTLQSDYFLDLSAIKSSTLRAERAMHLVGSVQRVFGNGLVVRGDVYHKRFNDLLVGRLETVEQRSLRLASYDVPGPLWSSVPLGPQITTTPQNAATGRAHGAEALVSYSGRSDATPFRAWAAYSFGRADRSTYGVTRPFDYDRRHALAIAATIRLGPRFDLSTTGRWATGLPRTPARGVRLALAEDVTDADGDGNRREWVPLRDAFGQVMFQPDLGDVANINTARGPNFSRLDARLTLHQARRGERWAVYLDVFNLLNTKNVALFDTALVHDPTSDRPRVIEVPGDRGIPLFPSIGVRVSF